MLMWNWPCSPSRSFLTRHSNCVFGFRSTHTADIRNMKYHRSAWCWNRKQNLILQHHRVEWIHSKLLLTHSRNIRAMWKTIINAKAKLTSFYKWRGKLLHFTPWHIIKLIFLTFLLSFASASAKLKPRVSFSDVEWNDEIACVGATALTWGKHCFPTHLRDKSWTPSNDVFNYFNEFSFLLQFEELGMVTSIESNHKNVPSARKGMEVCIKIDPIPGDSPKMFGRHFDETDILTSKVSEVSRQIPSAFQWSLVQGNYRNLSAHKSN